MIGKAPQYIGEPSLGLAVDTIATVLDLVEAGWQAACAKRELTSASQETDIAGRLAREMIAEKRKRRISHFRIEEEVGTRASLSSPKPEGRIDIKIIYSFAEEEYFGVECKRVSGSKSDGLSKKYVENGVMRFVSGKYSPGHGWAAMIGFVVDGDPAGAVKLIAEAIAAAGNAAGICDEWASEKRFGNHNHLYVTRHGQLPASRAVRILHLFLSLN